MANKCFLQALHTTTRDLRSNNSILGGVTLLLAGDFQQILPILPKGTPADKLNAHLKKSLLWLHVQSKQLTINMRSLLQTGQPTTQFLEMLLKISKGQITSDGNGYIDTTTIGHNVSSPNDLCSAIYLNLTVECIKPDWLHDRTVNTLNYGLLTWLPSQECFYRSVDYVTDVDQVTHFPTEFLNSQDPPGLPPHAILCNLNAPILSNGTCLLVKQMMDHFIEAQIIMGHGKNNTIFILKILLTPADFPYSKHRLQFSLELSFAMTINKAESQ
ncbi:uncharacterized protein LOC106872477 [Octopus bimaculoides]|uniref:uncharacterized protein LOC106872477 n=1 Tax=Octopus bimaculoides TaxID=37653 RepID=UPI00071CF2B8|nr:uncharacterized protein LOC106872477 [Octopus bimaculoides]|eukprot:XP_014774975.1 PREDICTED: uncharacterized protein LOC106872477 [Octopus bimaculoides]